MVGVSLILTSQTPLAEKCGLHLAACTPITPILPPIATKANVIYAATEWALYVGAVDEAQMCVYEFVRSIQKCYCMHHNRLTQKSTRIACANQETPTKHINTNKLQMRRRPNMREMSGTLVSSCSCAAMRGIQKVSTVGQAYPFPCIPKPQPWTQHG